MTLAQLLAGPLSPGELAGMALVFQQDLRDRLVAVQSEHGDPRFTAFPAEMTNGAFMHQASILTECQPGGLYWAGFSRLDASKFDEVAVVPYADAAALLAVSSPPLTP